MKNRKRAGAFVWLFLLALLLCGCDGGKKAAVYAFVFSDETGAKVPGVVISLCDDSTCATLTGDHEGRAVFTGKPYAYEVSVLKVPEGYDRGKVNAFVTEERGGEYTVLIPQSEK